jgi:hypothetical protein
VVPRTMGPMTLWRTVLACMVLAASGGAAAGQASRLTLDLVVERMMSYTDAYPHALGRVVAEERYEQRVWRVTGAGERFSEQVDVRITRAELGLAQVGREWVGIRDVVEVDGVRVPDAGRRLERALSQVDADDPVRAILRDNARFNVDAERIGRNINIPTMAVEFLRPKHRWRFSFARDGEETLEDGRRLWRIRFREHEHPTLVRQVDGRDQPLRGLVWLDPVTGEVLKTDLRWERGPDGHILVTYGRTAGIDPLVPLTMSEEYTDRAKEQDGSTRTSIRGEARYTNFRQFRTAGRLVTPQ